MAFDPVEKDDMILVDGFLYSNLSIGDPIERCREEVADDADIIIDVILCYSSPVKIKSWDDKSQSRWKTALDFYQRRKEIRKYWKTSEELQRMMRGFPDVHFRLIVEPGEKLIQHGALPINAKKEDTRNEIEIGKRAGIKAVEDLKASGGISNSKLVTENILNQTFINLN